MPKTLKEQLEESFDKDSEEQEEAGGSEKDTKEPVGAAEEEEELELSQGKESGDVDIDETDGKGEDGDKDVKQVSPEGDKPGDEEDSEGDKPGEELEAKAYNAPVSWKPAVREHWDKLPPEVQEEVTRRETEIQKGLQQASGAKRVAQEYMDVVRPYQHLIQAQNSTPAKSITNLMQTAAQLTMGSPSQKAQVIAEIIGNYAVDVEMLDSLLSGQEVSAEANPMLDQIDLRLKPINDFMNQFQGYRQQDDHEIVEQANSDLAMFQQEKGHDFYEDVREEMADIMELGAKHGRVVTLQSAYDQACQNNPEVKKVVDHRAAKERAALPSGDELANKRKAASSVAGSSPTGTGVAKENESLRDTIAAGFQDTGRV